MTKIGRKVFFLTKLVDGDKITGYVLGEGSVVSFDEETVCLVESGWTADRIRFRKSWEVYDTADGAHRDRIKLEAELKGGR